MRGCGQLARSHLLLASLAHRSITGATRRGGAGIASMASPVSPASFEADLARTSTSAETRQLLDRLVRSDASAGVLRVAVVGDVHGAWSDADAAAVRCLDADLLAFVGDFGNEAVPVVERISKVAGQIARRSGGGGGNKVPDVAVVCGNHDAWNSMTARGRERGRERARAAAAGGAGAAAGNDGADGAAVDDKEEEKNASGDPLVPAAASPGVAKQLRLLGKSHVGFSWRAFGDDGNDEEEGKSSRKLLAVVGGRPFSQGGPDFRRVEQFYREMYGVEDFEGSTERIVRSLREAAAHLSKRKERMRRSGERDDDGDDDDDAGAALVLIAHNGPSGLGKAKHDICGADFLEDGGDWGDPDLEEALWRVRSGDDHDDEDKEAGPAASRAAGTSSSSSSSSPSVSASPCLVAFGHMHRSLRHASSACKERNAVEICADTGTVFLNAAAWPRARELSSAVQRRVVPNDDDGGGGETEVESVRGAQTPPGSSLHHAVVVEVDRGVVTSAHDAWVAVSPTTTVSSSSSSSNGEGTEKKKKKAKLEATRLEMRELLRTERASGVDERGRRVLFRSVWRGWSREFELVASLLPASAPEGWEHWRFRE